MSYGNSGGSGNLALDGETLLLSEPTHAGSVVMKAPASANDDINLSPRYLQCKRAMDLCGTLVLALVFSPIMMFVVLRLKTEGGPVFFSHERVGLGGVIFKVHKFRTMVVNADAVLEQLLLTDAAARHEWTRTQKLKNDPRITRLGNFLRRTSLDELPQLWNVLKGEMSLVGPRPVVHDELEKYGRAVRYYFAVKPGITGLWQVTGRNNTDYRRRVALDRRYVRTVSIWNDFVVLLKTVSVVLRRSGAY